MKIEFNDKSYILFEVKDNIIISIGAPSQDNPLAMIVNTAELSKEEFDKIISSLQ